MVVNLTHYLEHKLNNVNRNIVNNFILNILHFNDYFYYNSQDSCIYTNSDYEITIKNKINKLVSNLFL